jgi:hypothetical protein
MVCIERSSIRTTLDKSGGTAQYCSELDIVGMIVLIVCQDSIKHSKREKGNQVAEAISCALVSFRLP